MTSYFSLSNDLQKSIEGKRAKVGVVGLGYVGLPLSLGVHDAGFTVQGVDIKADRVAAINAGEQLLKYLPADRISSARESGRYNATTDIGELEDADIVLVSVPTSIDANDQPDISLLLNAVSELAPVVRPGALIIIESTVYPGAIRTKVAPILAGQGHQVGQNLFLAFSPEREDPGNETFHTRNIPKLVGADDPTSLELAALFYRQVVETVIEVSSTTVAETVKLYENSFRTVNIALANEMKAVCRTLGIDVNEMIAAAATKPFGFMPFWPGPGIGGDCIPVSPVLLTARVKELGSALPIVDHAIQSSRGVPAGVVARAKEAAGGSLADKLVLLIGVSYKKDVGDVRRSPALDILDLVEAEGATCAYHDDLVPVLNAQGARSERRSIDLTPEAVRESDVVIIAADHSDTDFNLIGQNADLVVDTRNVFAGRGIPVAGRLVSA